MLTPREALGRIYKSAVDQREASRALPLRRRNSAVVFEHELIAQAALEAPPDSEEQLRARLEAAEQALQGIGVLLDNRNLGSVKIVEMIQERVLAWAKPAPPTEPSTPERAVAKAREQFRLAPIEGKRNDYHVYNDWVVIFDAYTAYLDARKGKE